MVTRIFNGNVLGNVLGLQDWPCDPTVWGETRAPVRKLSADEIAAYAKELEARRARRGK